MAECNYLGTCAFYNDRLREMPPTGEFIKIVFCLKTPEACQRRKRSDSVSVGDIDDITTPIAVNTTHRV